MDIAIETERLQLVQLGLEDAPFVFELVNDPSWLKYIGDRGVRTLEQAVAYLQNGPMASYATNGFGLYLVRRKQDGARMGMCGLVKRPSLPYTDIGYAFLPQFTGQGYAFEAATAVLQYAQTDLDLVPIVAITAPDNERSIKLLKKLGFHFQKMVKLGEDQAEVMLFFLMSDSNNFPPKR